MKTAPVETIRCLAWGIEHSRPNLDGLGRNLTLPIEMQSTERQVWWLDEDLNCRTQFVCPDDPAPQFECVSKPGIEVSIQGFASYSITCTR